MMQYDLLIFDVDGTLVSDFNSTALLPEVTQFFESLPKQGGPDIALATNQGGVGLRYWMEIGGFGDPSVYPTKAKARSRIFQIAEQVADLYRYPHIYIAWCYQSKSTGEWGPTPVDDDDIGWLPHWRKPAGGMIFQALTDSQVEPPRALVIGDRTEDWDAGSLNGCHVSKSKKFFELGLKAVYLDK
jgi:histidinol phosphatase-like enzyme